MGYSVADAVLAGTLQWLAQPAEWDNNHGNPGFSDTKLARIQFAAALTEARLDDRGALLAAAESLLPYQERNGSWNVDTGGLPGAPATYGATLATYMARRTLESADAVRFAGAIERANQWLRTTTPSNVPDMAATLLAFVTGSEGARHPDPERPSPATAAGDRSPKPPPKPSTRHWQFSA